MAKQRKHENPVAEESVSMNLGAINNYVGTIISINQKKITYWGCGERDESGNFQVWLSPQSYWAEVPEDLASEEADKIGRAILAGDIVVGKQWIAALDKLPGIKEKYLKLCLETPRLELPGAKDPWVKLVRKKSEGGHTALEILSYVKAEDAKRLSRPAWQRFLQSAIDAYDGPVSLVEDAPEDAYQVAIDPISMVIVDDTRKRDGDFEVPVGTPTVYSDPEAQNKALDEFFDTESETE